MEKMEYNNDARAALFLTFNNFEFTDDNKDEVIEFLDSFSYYPSNELRKWIKLPLLLEELKKRWLIEITIDENNIFTAKDISTTDDWQVESEELIQAKWIEPDNFTKEEIKEREEEIKKIFSN